MWSSTAGGTNWSILPTKLSDSGNVPGAGDDAFFIFPGASNFSNTTLGADFSIKGLNFLSNAGAVGIGGGNLLTIGTDGLSVQAGAGSDTISSNLAVGGVEIWANNALSASNTLTVSGVLSGSAALSLKGTGSTGAATGAFAFTGAGNTFSGPLSLVNCGHCSPCAAVAL